MPCAFVLLLVFVVFIRHGTAKNIYIVQTSADNKPSPYRTHADWYAASLSSLTNDASDSLLYVYDAAYQGYAAALEPEQAAALAMQESVLGIYEDIPNELQTTRTPHFLGVEDEFGLWDGGAPASVSGGNASNSGFPNVIVGVMDSGIIPESKSFSDAGFPEIPNRWKGECDGGTNFDPALCNRNFIGVRAYWKAYVKATGGNRTDLLTPRDHIGHGTHTASTIAGSAVQNVTYLGQVLGTARGVAPHARLAIYKVCFEYCYEADIIAGMDQAIKDGVDVISLSLIGKEKAYHTSSIAIGAFAAMEKGIFVSASAGNYGPSPGTVSNGAPWIMTVGASTLDRDFPAYVRLGNGQEFVGKSKYTGASGTGDQPLGLVYNPNTNMSKMCMNGTLDPLAVKGKIVVCNRGGIGRPEKSAIVKAFGAAGMILANWKNNGEVLMSDSFFLPAVMVGNKAGKIIKDYVMSTQNPTAQILASTIKVGGKPAPVVANFSSRGPYGPSVGILKPDVIGPGVDIVAAWPKDLPKSQVDKRIVEFNFMSGTSMSCPHISGLAVLLRVAHPQWSVSAIKSALMTTADINDNTLNPITQFSGSISAGSFSMGAGHVNPRKALSPGLVHDITRDEYVKFVCSLNYNAKQVQAIVRDRTVDCSSKFSDLGELNYPSFVVRMSKNRTTVQYTRELTNVGAPGSVYRVAITAPQSVVAVKVKPETLVFGSVGDKKRYTVTFDATGTQLNGTDGSITWYNGEQTVRSPVAFLWSSS